MQPYLYTESKATSISKIDEPTPTELETDMFNSTNQVQR